MNTQNAFPLSWPPAWKRAAVRSTSSFGNHSVDRAVGEILHQLKLLGCGDWNVVVSSNVPLRRDGLPKSGERQPSDPGVAIYFQLNKRPCVLACDKWNKVEDNFWAIAKDIEAQRGRIRWGVGSVEQAFAGYTALPAPGTNGGAKWWQILHVPETATYEQTVGAYRVLAMAKHPDVEGGSHDAMANLNHAMNEARLHFGR